MYKILTYGREKQFSKKPSSQKTLVLGQSSRHQSPLLLPTTIKYAIEPTSVELNFGVCRRSDRYRHQVSPSGHTQSNATTDYCCRVACNLDFNNRRRCGDRRRGVNFARV